MSVGTREPELQGGRTPASAWPKPAPNRRGSIPLYRWALSYLRPYRGSVWLLLLVSAAEVMLGLLRPWPLKWIVDYVLQPNRGPAPLHLPEFGVETALILGCVAYLVANGAAELMSAWHTQLQVTLGQRLVVDLRQQMFSHLQSLSLRFHLRRGTGDTIYHIENDSYCVESLSLSGVLPMAIASVTLGAMFFVLWNMNWQLAVASLAVLPALFLVNRSFMERMIARSEQLKEIESRGISFVQEVFSAIRVVKAFGREAHEADRFRVQGENIVAAKTRLSWHESFYGAAINLVTSSGTALVLFLGGRQVIGGEMTVGDLLVAMSYLASLFEPLSSMSRTVGKLQGAIASSRRVLRTLESQPEIHDRPGAITAPRLTGRVEFADVSFGYDSERPVLDRINFVAEPGQTIAIVGLTGAGKTTLVSLITRFYDVSAGRVTIDGRDMRDYAVKSLREQIAIVLQDPLLLSGTVADNIRYGRLDASDAEVEAAARAAYAHDFIMRLPRGYDTRLGEGDDGVQLSGGERQRVSIARALLRNAPILILDEPTSSLDARAEAHIFEALRGLMLGRTTFVIAHRLSTVRHADKILVLDGGRVVGFGRHEENLESVPLYRELCERLAV
jgi:ABC-type multidrug transport system fused ATPase/permease subunit